MKKYISLIIWIVLLITISSAIGNITKSSTYTWYQTLNHSDITPPGYIFGVVWSVLYVMIATSGWLIWQDRHSDNKLIKILYTLQMVLNWIWTPLFFGYHLTGVSLVCLIIIAALVATLVFKAYQKLITVSLLLVPYLLWLIFASYLNFYIWLHN